MIPTFSPERPGTTMLSVVGATLLALTLPLDANTARAEPACASHEAVGLANSGKLIQVFASADGVSWTVVLTQSDGTSCIAAAGRYWQPVTAKALAPEA